MGSTLSKLMICTFVLSDGLRQLPPKKDNVEEFDGSYPRRLSAGVHLSDLSHVATDLHPHPWEGGKQALKSANHIRKDVNNFAHGKMNATELAQHMAEQAVYAAAATGGGKTGLEVAHEGVKLAHEGVAHVGQQEPVKEAN